MAQASAAREARRPSDEAMLQPSSPLPFIISILPSLLSPSFVFLPPAVLSHPVHLRHHFLRPSPDSPGYLQATNDEVIQGAVEGRRERLITGRWAEEGGLPSDQGGIGSMIEWNATLREDDGIRARTVLGELAEERLALLLVWEDPKRVSMPAAATAAAAANNATADHQEEHQEPGWRFYDLQLPISKETWYSSLEEALLASGIKKPSNGLARNGDTRMNGQSEKASKHTKRKKPRTPQETGLQGEEGADPDPDDYWAGCSSSAGGARSSSGRSSRNGMRYYDDMRDDDDANEDSYWSSYGQQPDRHGPGSIDDDGRQQQEEEEEYNAEVLRNDPFGYDKTVTHSRKQSNAVHPPPPPAMIQRNVSFLPEQEESARIGGDHVASAAADSASNQLHEAALPTVNRAMSFMEEPGAGGSAYAESLPGGRGEPYYVSADNVLGNFGPIVNNDDDNRYNNNDDDDAESSYNYRGFYEYQEPGSSTRPASPTLNLMDGVSDKLEASQREAALKSAIRGVWGLYQMSSRSANNSGTKEAGNNAVPGNRRRSKTVTAKDPRIEQYEFLELVRSVVEDVDD